MNFFKVLIISMSVIIISACNNSNEYIESNQSIDLNISNLGKNQNSLGYYGEDVYLGMYPIVGNWILFYQPRQNKYGTYVLSFTLEGTGGESKANIPGRLPLESDIIQYGVNEIGDTITYQGQHEFDNNLSFETTLKLLYFDAQKRCFGVSYMYRNAKDENWYDDENITLCNRK